MNNREIDKLIAKWAGWTEIRESGFTGFDFVGIDPKHKPTDWYLIPNYSTNISAAWQVAEMLECRFGCGVNVEIRRKSMNKVWTGEKWERKRYYVTISGGELGYDNFNCSFTVYDDSLCLAICQAALKAVEAEVT